MVKMLRLLLTGTAVFCLISACSGGSGDGDEARPSVKPADLVLRGGTVATVDPAIGIAEAIAVNGYRITAVGSNDEIAAYVGPETEDIELEGRFATMEGTEGTSETVPKPLLVGQPALWLLVATLFLVGVGLSLGRLSSARR